MKILFLDIDSVLNHSKPAEDLYNGEECAGSPFVEDNVPLCKDNIAALKHIFEAVPDLKVVWSTDWRLYDKPDYHGFKNPRLWLEAQDWMEGRVIGKTPKKMSSTHYEEIRMWFSYEKKDLDIESFAILDDYDSYGMSTYFKDEFFKCIYDDGLTIDIADRAIAHLKGHC